MPRRRRSRIEAALAASLLLHAALLLTLFLFVPVPRIEVPPPVEVAIVPAESLDAGLLPRARSGGAPAGAARSAEASRAEAPARAPARTPEPSATTAADAAPPGAPPSPRLLEDGRAAREEVFEGAARGDAPRVPWLGVPGTPGGPAHPDDALDGVARLGSGEPGDPRIPGFGGVDLGGLLARDSTIAQAKERAERGQIHPFLFEAKRRMESCWLPTHDDARVLGVPKLVEDPVCAQGFHRRYRVAKVLVIYDAAGSRISLRLVGAPTARQLEERVKKAVDEAGLEARPPPPELLDERGLLRLAWNVYVDDYTGCNLLGRGTSGTRTDAVEYVVGVIELEGVF